MHVTARYKVIRDNAGVHVEIPVILTEDGPLMPLIDYLVAHSHVRSQHWMVKVVQGVGLLLDYMEANHECFADPKNLFESFVQRLRTGTVGDDGLDNSGLYWQGRGPAVVRQLVVLVSDFSDWLGQEMNSKPLNPWCKATRVQERMAWAAWHQKHDRAFLAHTWNREAASLDMTRARNVLLKRTPVIDHDTVKFFPEERISDLLFKGFIVPGAQKNLRAEERINLRDILITLLMHYGGLRMSEPFHLYVHDVKPDPVQLGRPLVRVYHPGLGTAPLDWPDAKGKPLRCNRATYLRGKYGMRPRDEYPVTAQLHAGWKDNALDGKDCGMSVHWYPQWAAELFWRLWVPYLIQRANKCCSHPFAFVTKDGKPYAIDSFETQHRRAVERIGLTAAKALGTTPHGHRHAYGQRLTDAEIDPIYRKKALHHKSLESQVVYTEPDRVKLDRLLAAATERDKTGLAPQSLDPLAFGFGDVDPLGLMSGPNPKLSRRH